MRDPHEQVAAVLVDPAVLGALELDLMGRDLWVWPVATAPNVVDGERAAFQMRRRMVMARRGAWDDAHDFAAIWVSFGASWRDGAEPLPWAAHEAVWATLRAYGDRVRFRPALVGVPPLSVPVERSA